MAELEQRLAVLEESIGLDRADRPGSLADSLTVLERKVELLDQAQMDQVARKAQALSQHMAALIKQKKAAAPSSEQDEQIVAMYETIERWDGVAKQLPGLVAKLRVLHQLHTEGGGMVDSIKQLQAEHAELSGRLSSEAGQLTVVEESLKQNMATINGNMQALEQRIGKLG